jgi:hypothetical protein
MPTKQEDMLDALAQVIGDVLPEIYGEKMGFFLSVFHFIKPGTADYISNGKREDVIKALRETANRLEKNEVIPVTIGES